MINNKKPKPKKDRDYLSFAKEQRGYCCICRWTEGSSIYAEELHHWGDKGMAQKCSDYEVARVCIPCHKEWQGKRRIAFLRMNRMDVLEALERDALDMLIEYVEWIKTR